MEVCHVVNLADQLALAPEQAGHDPFTYVYTDDAGEVVATLSILPFSDPSYPSYLTHVHALLCRKGERAQRIYGLHYAADGRTKDTHGNDYGKA